MTAGSETKTITVDNMLKRQEEAKRTANNKTSRRK